MASAIRQQIQEQMIVDSAASEQKTEKSARRSIFQKTASAEEVTAFYRSFSVLMKSGYTVHRALTVLSETVSNKDLAKTLSEIAQQIEKGTSLSKAVSAYPQYFTQVSIGVFKAAEETARLSEALEFLADTAELWQETRQQVTEAVSYPVFVSVVSSALICAILYFVVPQFSAYIGEAGVTISGFSAIVFSISEIVRLPFVMPAFFVATIIAIQGVITWSRRNPMGFYRTLGRIPLVGSVMLKGSMVRFVSMFHMMNANGVPVAKSLKMAEATVANAVLRKAIGDMANSVEQGRSMTEPLSKYPFPVRFVDMLRLGEQTGQFDQLLPNLTRTLINELKRTTTRVTMASEPVMLLVLGSVVLMILLSFFMPYFDVISAMSIG